MKKTVIAALSLLLSSTVFSGCGGFGPAGQSEPQTAPQANNSAAAGANILGSLLGAATGAGDASSLLTGVIGSVMNGAQSASIVGKWVYAEPSIEFESANLLAQAGGAVASAEMVKKLTPYYEKLGIKPGAVAITFNKDNTCLVEIGGKTQTANYAYDKAKHTLTITGQDFGLSFGTAYATVTLNQLSLTFDSSKLLSTAKSFAAASQNSTLNTISTLSQSFSGMKTGFKFVKK